MNPAPNPTTNRAMDPELREAFLNDPLIYRMATMRYSNEEIIVAMYKRDQARIKELIRLSELRPLVFHIEQLPKGGREE